MRTIVHFLVYLSLGLWLGALAFFGAILAPVAFSRIPPLFANYSDGMHAAGIVVGESLRRLHWMGLVLGVVFLILILLARHHYRTVIPQVILVLAMIGITAYMQFSVIPNMETARISVGGSIEAVSPTNPGRELFDRLHRLSEKLEGGVLICGLLALLATSCFARGAGSALQDDQGRNQSADQEIQPAQF